jgi:hypothetical protein
MHLTFSPFLPVCSTCSLAAAVMYGTASMAMVFVNKAVVMQYAHSMTLLTLQVLLSITDKHCFLTFD